MNSTRRKTERPPLDEKARAKIVALYEGQSGADRMGVAALAERFVSSTDEINAVLEAAGVKRRGTNGSFLPFGD